MKKTHVVAVAVACLAAAGAYAWVANSATEAGVAKVANNPAAFVGRVKMIGKAGRVDPARGLVEIVDDKACCNLVVAVPFSDQQGTALAVVDRYSGSLPQPGQALEVHGAVREASGGYQFEVNKMTSGGKVVLKKL